MEYSWVLLKKCISCVTVCHCVSLYVTVCHCVLLCVTVCEDVPLDVTVALSRHEVLGRGVQRHWKPHGLRCQMWRGLRNAQMTLGSSITFKSLLSTFITTKPLTLDCIMFQDVSRFWHCVLCINDYYRVTVTILCLKLVSGRAGPGFRRVLARSSQPGAQRLRERLNFDVDSRHRVDTVDPTVDSQSSKLPWQSTSVGFFGLYSMHSTHSNASCKSLRLSVLPLRLVMGF